MVYYLQLLPITTITQLRLLCMQALLPQPERLSSLLLQVNTVSHSIIHTNVHVNNFSSVDKMMLTPLDDYH